MKINKNESRRKLQMTFYFNFSYFESDQCELGLAHRELVHGWVDSNLLGAWLIRYSSIKAISDRVILIRFFSHWKRFRSYLQYCWTLAPLKSYLVPWANSKMVPKKREGEYQVHFRFCLISTGVDQNDGFKLIYVILW